MPRGTPNLLAAAVVLLALSGCATNASPNTGSAHLSSAPSSSSPVTPEPFTHQEELVAQGARLIVAGGCSACHLQAGRGGRAPSFASFAGHHVKLANGQRVLVDERFLREVLLHPRAQPIAGYSPAPMLAAVDRLHLGHHPREVTALAAFIEEVGPEPE